MKRKKYIWTWDRRKNENLKPVVWSVVCSRRDGATGRWSRRVAGKALAKGSKRDVEYTDMIAACAIKLVDSPQCTLYTLGDTSASCAVAHQRCFSLWTTCTNVYIYIHTNISFLLFSHVHVFISIFIAPTNFCLWRGHWKRKGSDTWIFFLLPWHFPSSFSSWFFFIHSYNM